MPTDGGDGTDSGRALDGVVRDALAGLTGAAPGDLDAVDARSLGMGIRLGLERPDRAREVLGALDDAARGAGDAPAGVADASDGLDGAATPSIPVASSLLARAAAIRPSDWETVGPDVVFGWVARLTAAQILHLGRVVGDMLAAGASTNVELGFGFVWTDGVRIPRPELDVMLQEFTELEITVGGILDGNDYRAAAQPTRGGLASWFGDWIPRARPGESQAAAAVERKGVPARRGLVALWNVWIAMRYRRLIPPPTFELLVQPWVTAIGPLPDPT
jgi:hypothetical protein